MRWGQSVHMASVNGGTALSDSLRRTYTWDSQKRMVSCTYRGQTTVGGVTTYYAYDGTVLVREFQTNQQTGLLAPSVTYMVGPMGPCCRINEQNQSEGYYPAGVTSTTPLTRGVTRWYVYDGLGSVIGELDADNNMTTSGQYDVYGAPRAGTQQGVAATASQAHVGGLGHVTDASTCGLIYTRARCCRVICLRQRPWR